MTRLGVVNALARAIQETWPDQAAMRARFAFFTDVTKDEISEATALAEWLETPAGKASDKGIRFKPGKATRGRPGWSKAP